MVVELGHFALILAFGLALAQAFLPLAGVVRGIRDWAAAAVPLACGQFLFVSLAFACLAYAFMVDDFSVRLVATNSNTLLPP